jgi:hypothetical protein
MFQSATTGRTRDVGRTDGSDLADLDDSLDIRLIVSGQMEAATIPVRRDHAALMQVLARKSSTAGTTTPEGAGRSS